MIIPVFGPPKAGMTPAVQYLWLHDLVLAVECRDMDGALGKRWRSNGPRAIEMFEGILKNPPSDRVLVDIGAAQLMAPEFVDYLTSSSAYPSSVVMWCDEPTSRRRHGGGSELHRYFGAGPLDALWETARVAGRVVDTSGEEVPERWARDLAEIVSRILNASVSAG
jgi:hypothetical protein